MADESEWMLSALEEAEKAFGEDEVPIGCVVVHENRIIGRGHNMVEQSGDPLAHAEMIAIRDAIGNTSKWSLCESSVYVTVEPCVMCMGAMLLARIPKVVYGSREPETGACGSVLAPADEPGLNHRIAVIGGVSKEKSRLLMKRFFERKRR
jgi:tRNA(adenine34) deaminase